MSETPKRKRRWLQFSLRSLLIFTALCAIAAALLGRKIERKRQEQLIVNAIRETGGSVYYDSATGTEPNGPSWLRALLGDGFFSEVRRVYLRTDGSLQDLKQLTYLEQLDLRDAYGREPALSELKGLTQLRSLAVYDIIREDGMRSLNDLTSLEFLAIADVDVGVRINLQNLKQLKGLNLRGTGAFDTDVASIKHLTQLEWINLSDTRIADDGLEQLKELPQLKALFLDRAWVHDDGLAHLKGLTKLESLSLGGTRVTDVGLANLTALKQLRSLDLSSTKVTNAGVADLQKALPHCQISR